MTFIMRGLFGSGRRPCRGRVLDHAEPLWPAGETDPFYSNKQIIGRYYVQPILPQTSGHLAKLKSGSELMMALPTEAF